MKAGPPNNATMPTKSAVAAPHPAAHHHPDSGASSHDLSRVPTSA